MLGRQGSLAKGASPSRFRARGWRQACTYARYETGETVGVRRGGAWPMVSFGSSRGPLALEGHLRGMVTSYIHAKLKLFSSRLRSRWPSIQADRGARFQTLKSGADPTARPAAGQ